MKLLLDTTYFLPAIGISVKGLPDDAVIKLIEKGHEIYISEVTIFELAAKGAKYVLTGDLAAEKVSRGVRTIVYDDRITRIPLYDSSTLLTAIKLRGLLNDFVDCLILSSAISQCDALITEDKDIQSLKERKEFQEIPKPINPKLKILTLAEAL